MPGRRWSDGLHQAVEAKEGLPIQNESITLASISYQARAHRVVWVCVCMCVFGGGWGGLGGGRGSWVGRGGCKVCGSARPPAHTINPRHTTPPAQNFFRAYPKLAGMTGTAATEAAEFAQIYNLPVTVVPPNRTVARLDNPDVVFRRVGGWSGGR